MLNVARIENHGWFSDIVWNDILYRKFQAPFIPQPFLLDGCEDAKHDSQTLNQ